METTTKNGMKVSLNVEGSRIVAEITHPQLGKIVGKGDSWGVVGNGEAGLIVDATIKGKRSSVCLTIDNAIFRSLMAEIEAAKDARRASVYAANKEKALVCCPAGKVLAIKIADNHECGLSDYRTEDGVVITAEDTLQDSFGFYFISLSAVEREIKWQEEKSKKRLLSEKKETARVEEIKTLAIETGKKQLINTDAIETSGRDENSLILRQTWAMPDGTVETRIVNAH